VVVNASEDMRRDGAQATDAAVPQASAVIWHDLECGSYAADLPLWRELACAARELVEAGEAPARAHVLDIGAGSGRVALDLARHGHRVTALDRDGELLAAVRERAAGMDVETVQADARSFALERRDFALCIVPMQTIQLLGGAAERLELLRRARAHLAPGGVLACAIVTELDPFDCYAGDLGPSPEVTRIGETTYMSRATRVQVGRHVVRIERERSVLAPTRPGPARRPARERDVVELDRVSVARLQREGRDAGLTAAGTRLIAATEEHTASTAVIFHA
jgi:SAM-dependent methyltransferase